MDINKAISYAKNSMHMEGFKFTPKEEELLREIAAGKKPLSDLAVYAASMERVMKEKFPEDFVPEDDAEYIAPSQGK